MRFWALLLVPLTLLGMLAAWLITTTFSEVSAYGTVPVPGSNVLHLPAGDVEINFATNSPGGQGGSFFTPAMSLQVVGVSGSAPSPAIKHASSGASTFGSQTRAVAFRMRVLQAGDYRVIAGGRTSAYIDPELLFGHGAPDGLIFGLAGIVIGSAVLIAFIAGRVALWTELPDAPGTVGGTSTSRQRSGAQAPATEFPLS